jgi:hypothetical protein
VAVLEVRLPMYWSPHRLIHTKSLASVNHGIEIGRDYHAKTAPALVLLLLFV